MDRFKLIAEVHLLLYRGSDILLLRRFNTGYQDGNYSVVAGHVDGDEPIGQAMIREAKEEAGIFLEPDALTFAHVMHRRDGGERVSFFFRATRWTGAITNCEPEKCDDLRWFPRSQLPKNMVPYVRDAIVDDGLRCYSEIGW